MENSWPDCAFSSFAPFADVGRCASLGNLENRLAGLVATLWFFFALLSLFIALVFSPMGLRLLLPGTHPGTWVYPALLTLPPIALGCQKLAGRVISRLMLWTITLSLAVVALLLFAFLAASFVGY